MSKVIALPLLAMVCVTAVPAAAWEVNVPGVAKISDRGVAAPDPITVGPVTVQLPSPIPAKPSDAIVPPAPAVHVNATGDIADGVNAIEQKRQNADAAARRTADDGIKAAAAAVAQIGEATWRTFVKLHTWPFDLAGDWLKSLWRNAMDAVTEILDKVRPLLLLAIVFVASLISLVRGMRLSRFR